jgi:NAD(P)-dependent dehydrogenase (short-subunit alcohol dehydrogenase family)
MTGQVNTNNVRGTFLTVKHFLLSVKRSQETQGSELDNVAIVITGSETGKFGQEGHSESVSRSSLMTRVVPY